ncbi:MAG: PssD/Cps14F family polysaccharide biosynthesis glycosyltransferase [Mycoplasmatales bacterium]
MKKVLLVSSSGGHFAELNKINLDEKYQKIIVTEKNKDTIGQKNVDYYVIYGSRKKLIKYLFIFLLNSLKALKIIVLNNPQMIISTGAHSCVPFFIIGKLLKKKTIYIESFAKVTTPSLTYKIAHKFMDEVVVQHEEMLKVYPNAKYYGGIY